MGADWLIFWGSRRIKLGIMHLTPLKDQKGYVEAWAVVFGA